ncbi:hypothetical protein DITRI_Ditri06bG0165800 [Diplodiscus trichospermus]
MVRLKVTGSAIGNSKRANPTKSHLKSENPDPDLYYIRAHLRFSSEKYLALNLLCPYLPPLFHSLSLKPPNKTAKATFFTKMFIMQLPNFNFTSFLLVSEFILHRLFLFSVGETGWLIALGLKYNYITPRKSYELQGMFQTCSDAMKIDLPFENIKERMNRQEAARKEKEEEKENMKLTPNKINSDHMDKYSWVQDNQEVNVTITASPETKSSDVLSDIQTNYLKVWLKDQDPFIEGLLFEDIVEEDSNVSLDLQNRIIVHLIKKDGTIWWESLLKEQQRVPGPRKLSEKVS